MIDLQYNKLDISFDQECSDLWADLIYPIKIDGWDISPYDKQNSIGYFV